MENIFEENLLKIDHREKDPKNATGKY